jgi:UDP-N-acetylglucosamine:LPS N-acetylglucosamine transferase
MRGPRSWSTTPELDADRLVAEAAAALRDDDRRRAMGEAARRIGRPDAARELASELCASPTSAAAEPSRERTR